jgi:L,D-transpeptidase YcbB
VLYGKPYRGFESPPLRHLDAFVSIRTALFFLLAMLVSAVLATAQDTTVSGGSASRRDTTSYSLAVLPDSAVARMLQTLVHGAPVSIGVYNTPESRRMWKILRDFYAERSYRPAWIREGDIPLARRLFDAVRQAAEHGLDPSIYPVSELEARIGIARAEQASPEAWAAIDLSLSHLFVTYAAHLGRGRVDPRDVDSLAWYLPKRRVGVGHALATVAETGELERVLNDVESHRPEYRALLNVLRDLRSQRQHGWPKVPTWKFKAAPGDTRSELVMVRKYLQAMGDLPAGPAQNPAVMDDMLMCGVMHFQSRHGLTPDGLIGPRTAAEIRRPPSQLIRTVVLNLERWRWVPDTLETHYVMVNVPAYAMEVVEGDSVVLAMRVIAGAFDTPTPSFQGLIRHLEINPPWHVPESIASAEILPKVQKDPDYLLAENITVFDTSGNVVDPAMVKWTSLDPASLPYRFRQEPGDKNPLGSIKFLFPNRWSVYLHDTPNTKLFNKEQRALSHGCVRIEHPLDLANYLLRGQTTMTPEELEAFVKTGKRRWIDLKETEPIYLVYFTAFVDRSGLANFRPDVYGRDTLLEQALAAYPSQWSPPSPDTTAIAGPPVKP